MSERELAVGGDDERLVGMRVHDDSSGGGGERLGDGRSGRAAAGELSAGRAAVAPPVQLDAGGGVDDGLDGTATEQNSGPVTGAVDVEHAVNVRPMWTDGKVQCDAFYQYHFS